MDLRPRSAAFGLGHGIRAVFAAPGAAAFAVKNAVGRGAEYRVDVFAADTGLGPELLSALRWFATSESTGCGLPPMISAMNTVIPAVRAMRLFASPGPPIRRLIVGWHVSPPASNYPGFDLPHRW